MKVSGTKSASNILCLRWTMGMTSQDHPNLSSAASPSAFLTPSALVGFQNFQGPVLFLQPLPELQVVEAE